MCFHGFKIVVHNCHFYLDIATFISSKYSSKSTPAQLQYISFLSPPPEGRLLREASTFPGIYIFKHPKTDLPGPPQIQISKEYLLMARDELSQGITDY